MIQRTIIAAWAALAVAASFVEGALAAASPSCDRACLEGVMDKYLTALAAHNASQLPTTPNVLYVENDQILDIGTGEWQVAGSPGKYRHVFSDPQQGQVGTITTITENGVRIIYIARLKVEADGKISEIETQITRDSSGAALYENMTTPEAVWLQAVPADQRIPRETLVSQVNKYYSGMERNDPKGDYSFFDKDCNRLEDAVQTTNQKTGAAYGHSNDTVFASLGCQAQFQTGFLGFVTRIRERRFPVVDEERQAVLAMTTLDHNGTVRFLPDVNGIMAPIPHYFDVPRSLQAAEAFRLKGDKLYRIEMTLTEVPYRMRSPFHVGAAENLRYNGSDSASMARNNSTTAAAPPKPFPQPCNRTCLHDVTERVLEALLAHDATALPLANNAQYSENGQFLEWNNGLWNTLQKVTWPGNKRQSNHNNGSTDDSLGGGYAIHLADPATNTAGYWGLGQEQVTPGVLALRIQLDQTGRISEVEALDVRAETTGARGGTMTLMRPPLPVEWQGDSLGVLNAVFREHNNATSINNASIETTIATTIPSTLMDGYFTGLERHASAGVPLAPGCARRDNGQQLSGNGSTCAMQMDGVGPAPDGLTNATTAVRDRRVLAKDSRRGLVLAVAMVDNPAVPKAGAPSPLPATERVPGTYMVPQLLKVDNGTITRVESMIKWVPYGYKSAWSDEKKITG